MNPYCELVIKGHPDLVKGFLIGYFEGKGWQDETIIEEECRMEEDSLYGMFLHFLTSLHDRTAIVVRAGHCEALREALEKRKREIPSEIVSVREVSCASFTFMWTTFSPEVEKSLLTLFSNLSPEVKLEGYAPREKVMLEGKGVDAYAPLHEFESRARGTASGGVKEIYDLYCRAGRYEVIKTGDLKLYFKEDAG